MAIVRFEGEEREIANGSRVQEFCEDMGMPFGCTEGLCGTCRCTIVDGMQNLEPLNDREMDMGLEDGERLACQCVVISGSVEFGID